MIKIKHIFCDNKSVGMLIWKQDKLLLIERRIFPFGFAPPAGHVDDKGSFENAAKEEVEEEVGLNLVSLKLLIEGKKKNRCSRINGSWHYWKIYEVIATGRLKRSKIETKKAGWYSRNEILKLTERTKKYLDGKIKESQWNKSPGLEPVWYKWLTALKII